jgi:hypothetical protein
MTNLASLGRERSDLSVCSINMGKCLKAVLATVGQSAQRLDMGWTTEGSEFESPVTSLCSPDHLWAHTGGSFQGVLDREADHSSRNNVEIKKRVRIHPLPIRLRSVMLS